MGLNQRRMGIIGGTFDPIHYGHLIAAEVVWQRFRLEKVLFIPASTPPHKDEPEASPKDRYEMVRLAISSNDHFDISNIELGRPGKSYSVETLTELRSIYGEDTDLYFIIGADSVTELSTWKEFHKLRDFCELVAVTRVGYPLPLDKGDIEIAHFLEIPGVDISSTQIREKVRKGDSIRYLVPKEVEEYIYREGLY